MLLLGRYRHMQPLNVGSPNKQYPGLRFSYMTVHRAKGLEADYVVVLGLCAGNYGFPVGIADDPLLDLVLAAPEARPPEGDVPCPQCKEGRLERRENARDGNTFYGC